MNRDSFATAATPSMQSHESPHAQVKDEERDEVYFDEFCNMLDALEEREKREKKEREALLIREALRHHASCSLLPCASLEDSAQSDALRLLDDALLARLEEPSSSESEDEEAIKSGEAAASVDKAVL